MEIVYDLGSKIIEGLSKEKVQSGDVIAIGEDYKVGVVFCKVQGL